jgi:hypothetical protein
MWRSSVRGADANTTSYSYDAAGNLVSTSKGFAATYNGKEQMVSVTPPGGSVSALKYADADQTIRTDYGTTHYTYTLLGMASQKTGTGAIVYFTQDAGGNLTSVRNGTGTTNKLYYTEDGLGSIGGVTNSSGTLTSYANDPYGATVGTRPTTTPTNPDGFASGYLDASGLYKFGTRYYDPG